jgi:hypothetical protein
LKPFYVFGRFKLRDVYFSLQYLGSLERLWPIDGSLRIFDPKMGLWLATGSKRSPKISYFGHDGAQSIRNLFMLMMKTPSKYSFEHLCYGHDLIKVPI